MWNSLQIGRPRPRHQFTWNISHALGTLPGYINIAIGSNMRVSSFLGMVDKFGYRALSKASTFSSENWLIMTMSSSVSNISFTEIYAYSAVWNRFKVFHHNHFRKVLKHVLAESVTPLSSRIYLLLELLKVKIADFNQKEKCIYLALWDLSPHSKFFARPVYASVRKKMIL